MKKIVLSKKEAKFLHNYFIVRKNELKKMALQEMANEMKKLNDEWFKVNKQKNEQHNNPQEKAL